MKIKNLLLFMLLIVQQADAQFSYFKMISYNDSLSPFQYPAYMIETKDNKYVFLQSHWRVPSNYVEIQITKTDTAGNVIWSNHIARQDTTVQYLSNYGCIVQLPDSGFAISGASSIAKIGLIRCDKNGNLLWVKEYKSVSGNSLSNQGNVLVVDSSIIIDAQVQGTIQAAGYIKTDLNGNLITSHFTNINNYWSGDNASANTSDGGFLIACNVYTPSNNIDIGLIKYDAAGTIQWTRHYYNSTGTFAIFDVKELPAGAGYVMCGTYITPGFQLYGFVCHVSLTGQMLWGGIANTTVTRFYSINAINANDVLITGYISSSQNAHIKMSVSGSVLDAFTYNPVVTGSLPLYCGFKTSDNKYITYGSRLVQFNSDMLIFKTDINTFDGCNKFPSTNAFTPISFTDSTQYTIVPEVIADTVITQQYSNNFVQPFIQTVCGVTAVPEIIQNDFGVQIYSVSNSLNIDFATNLPGKYSVSIFDISGRETYHDYFNNKKSVSIPFPHAVKGLYFVKLRGESWTKHQHVLLGF